MITSRYENGMIQEEWAVSDLGEHLFSAAAEAETENQPEDESQAGEE